MRIDGKEIAAGIFEELKKQVGKLQKRGVIPYLAIILVGEDPASQAYVRQKELKAAEIGARAKILNYESGIKNEELLKTIQKLNDDSAVHGIIVQRPLPPQINSAEVNFAVNPKKDIDAFHPQTTFTMPLAAAVIQTLEKVHASTPGVDARKPQGFLEWLKAKNIVVVGKGETAGKPVIEILKKQNIPFTIVDSKTPNPETITKTADIVISAIGKPNIIKKGMIKNGAILIGVGMGRGKDGKLHGDYKEEEIKDVTSFYTPIPGGVGPVNVAMLLKNLVHAAEKSLL